MNVFAIARIGPRGVFDVRCLFCCDAFSFGRAVKVAFRDRPTRHRDAGQFLRGRRN